MLHALNVLQMDKQINDSRLLFQYVLLTAHQISEYEISFCCNSNKGARDVILNITSFCMSINHTEGFVKLLRSMIPKFDDKGRRPPFQLGTIALRRCRFFNHDSHIPYHDEFKISSR